MANDQFYKPWKISPPYATGIVPPNPGGNIYNDLNPGSTYDPIPAGTTIIDQATFLNAQAWALPIGPDPNFVPTEYIATQDGNNDITHLNIDVSNLYGGTSEPYRIINSDNLIALTHPTLGVGVDVYNPGAIMAGIDLDNNTGFSLLYATIISTVNWGGPKQSLQKLRPKSVQDYGIAGVSYTTTERDAAAPWNGWIVYNSTDNKFQGYANGAWVDLH